jgi:acetyltransferase-like isoleucine patch superfamily enzyme
MNASASTAPKPRRAGLSLNRLLWLRKALMRARIAYFNRVWGMDIHPTAEFSLSTRFDLTYPQGVHVGAHTQLAFESRILCHDRSRGIYRHTRIGANCFIGGRSLIMPGVEVGDGSIVGAGAIVTKSVPPGCIVAGNPARVIREGIRLTHYGRFVDADARGESWKD